MVVVLLIEVVNSLMDDRKIRAVNTKRNLLDYLTKIYTLISLNVPVARFFRKKIIESS